MVDTNAGIVGGACVLTVLSYIIILSRLALRRLKHERFRVDDYLMGLAMVFYAFNTAMQPLAVYNGNNLFVTNAKDLSPEELNHVILGSKWLVIGRPFYMSCLWTLKTCLLIYFTYLTERRTQLLVIKCAGVILAATWLANILTYFLECRPLSLAWQVLPDTPQCARAIIALYVVSITNIATNLMLMIIPLRLIAGSVLLPRKKKIELAALYLLGCILIFVTILRMILVLCSVTQQSRLLSGQLESFTATVVANAPVIHGLWRHGFMHLRKMKFGKDEDCPPEYTIMLHRATGEDGEWRDIGGGSEMEGEERRRSRRYRARKSIRKIRDRLRHSFEALEIHRSIELLQETKTGIIDHGDRRDDNQFSGMTPVAQIITHIGTGLSGVPQGTGVGKANASGLGGGFTVGMASRREKGSWSWRRNGTGSDTGSGTVCETGNVGNDRRVRDTRGEMLGAFTLARMTGERGMGGSEGVGEDVGRSKLVVEESGEGDLGDGARTQDVERDVGRDQDTRGIVEDKIMNKNRMGQ